ncbi:MAG: NAD(P)/FAD-dependent oxidoreductase [Lachnospiraceae bacterium]|nr:NAD(P)/FAD-dependent oxidoreductase [Lachnospiraceae bacterium]
MTKLAVIGGGAAGMMASVFAARQGLDVHVYEKNEKLGKKLYITGKGRCNLTNACEMEELLTAVKSNPKFLYSAFYGFTNRDTMDFFEQEGLSLKTERGNRVFPCSDKSVDVLDTLKKAMKRAGVHVHLHAEVMGITCTVPAAGQPSGIARADTGAEKINSPDERSRFFLSFTDGHSESADLVFVATGGLSYASTGSTGDGYRFAEGFGLKTVKTCPSLVPFNVREDWVRGLQGLSLKNVEIRVLDGKKELCRDFGEMLFTHFGVSGPMILTASSVCARALRERELKLILDLKPALSEEQLDARILREFEQNRNKQFRNVLPAFLPSKLVPVMYELCEISPEKRIHEITKEERRRFLHSMKELELTLTGLRGYNEAVITKGGVSVREIDPSTMESKKVPGLYFIGEVLDLDAVTGGFNLQIAWSTAVAAARSVGGGRA